jgi:periplasmic divalent cation tolerance protein
MEMNSEYLVVLCTCPTAGDADAVATALLEQQLAACVNRVPGVRSMYRWEGKVEQDDEVMLVIKTATRHFERLEAAVRTLHPHEVPEIIGLPVVVGSRGYLDWIGESVS